jgi:hypothetical protein
MRLSASCRYPERRSDDGQTILEGTRTGLKSCPDLQFLVELKRARTADLLHAIWRQHVHPRPYPQVTVLPRPPKSARVQVCCCTSVLYRYRPRRGHQPWPQIEP